VDGTRCGWSEYVPETGFRASARPTAFDTAACVPSQGRCWPHRALPRHHDVSVRGRGGRGAWPARRRPLPCGFPVVVVGRPRAGSVHRTRPVGRAWGERDPHERDGNLSRATARCLGTGGLARRQRSAGTASPGRDRSRRR